MQAGTIAGAAFLKSLLKEAFHGFILILLGLCMGVKPNSINPKGVPLVGV